MSVGRIFGVTRYKSRGEQRDACAHTQPTGNVYIIEYYE